MKSDNPAWRHHYLPQFYLRQWTKKPANTVWRYRRLPSGALEEKPVSPRSTGFVEDLYKYRHAVSFWSEEPTDTIEKGFFGKIDDDAARAHSKLLADATLDEESRHAWALFLVSMLLRTPQGFAHRDALAPSFAQATLETVRAQIRSEDSGRRLEDLLAAVDIEAMGLNTARESVIRDIKDERTIAYFKASAWSVVAADPKFPLVTTDLPLIANLGDEPRPVEALSLALSPSRLFLMRANPDHWGDAAELQDTVRQLIVAHNFMHAHGPAESLYSQEKLADVEPYRLRSAVSEQFGCSKS